MTTIRPEHGNSFPSGEVRWFCMPAAAESDYVNRCLAAISAAACTFLHEANAQSKQQGRVQKPPIWNHVDIRWHTAYIYNSAINNASDTAFLFLKMGFHSEGNKQTKNLFATRCMTFSENYVSLIFQSPETEEDLLTECHKTRSSQLAHITGGKDPLKDSVNIPWWGSMAGQSNPH